MKNQRSHPLYFLKSLLSSRESEKIMNYQTESILFIKTAFRLLDDYKIDPYSLDYDSISYLHRPYGLKINKKGQLTLVKIEVLKPECERSMIIGHTYGNKYSQITYIGNLLATYLEYLQMDEN